MPIWEERQGTGVRGQGSVRRRVIGSIAELREWAVDPKSIENLTDLHREYLDDVEVWVDDERTVRGRRIPEVFDCWVESGSMPFAQVHYPFENKVKFEKSYPAQYITEYIAQTRAWFYCMHVLSVAIFGSHAFENSLTTGTILAEDGQKMSKSKKNYPDPMDVINKYGVDSLRLYLMSSPVMKAENLNFSEKSVHEIQNKVINILWNMYGFWNLYAKDKKKTTHAEKKLSTVNYQLSTLHVLDRWLLSRLANVTAVVSKAMDEYDVVTASRLLIEFTQEFSTWYVRLSRERLREDEYPESKEIFGRALVTLAKLFAPLIPFTSELLYQGITQTGESIHLTDWPAEKSLSPFVDAILELSMRQIQIATEKTHAVRKEAGIKVRQPLAKVVVHAPGTVPDKKVLDVFLAEVNVESVEWNVAKEVSVELDTTLTPDLLEKGTVREVIRTIQDMRKEATGVSIADMVDAWLPEWPESHSEEIKAKTRTRILHIGPAKIEKV